MSDSDEHLIVTPLETTIGIQMQKFDEWLRFNLDRSFPDEAILAVFQFHVIQGIVNTGITFEHMIKVMKNQYDDLIIKKNKLIADHLNEKQAKSNVE